MSKRMRLMATLFAAAMVTVFTGCGSNVSKVMAKPGRNAEVHAAIVVGKHANTKEIPMDASAVKDLLYETSYTCGEITFINCDGKPEVYGQFDIPEPEVSGLSEAKKKTIAKGYTEGLAEMLPQAPVKAEECDYLAAIMKGAAALKTEGERKELLVLGSGLSTTGPLDYTKGYLNAKPEDIVKALQAGSAIPDLKGVDVVWAFCGETAAPQEELSYGDKANLKAIWTEILLEGGANSVTFSNSFASDKVYEGLPNVSKVKPSDNSISVEVPEVVIKDDLELIETFVLDDSSVNFKGDSAEFVDDSTAMEALEQLAQVLIEHPNNQVFIVGTTATGREAYTQQLSQNRAEAVQRTLVELGVSEEQLIAVGLGSTDHWHLDDTDSNGHLIESIARLNRKVLILDSASEDAYYVMNR